jgi:hypothetical protein
MIKMVYKRKYLSESGERVRGGKIRGRKFALREKG